MALSPIFLVKSSILSGIKLAKNTCDLICYNKSFSAQFYIIIHRIVFFPAFLPYYIVVIMPGVFFKHGVINVASGSVM